MQVRPVFHAFRQLGWIVAFLALLAAMLLPLILLSASSGRAVSIVEQLALIAVATAVIQLLRRKPIWEVTGRPDLPWLIDLSIGLGLGALLMLVPAAFLWAGGWLEFTFWGNRIAALLGAALLMATVASAEELLFRGVLFQRLIDAAGKWPAQVLIAGLFTLTHLGNPGMVGEARIWAGANIFIASLLFGACYLRTGRLALPIGLHFAANLVQGVILGFGVSGDVQPHFLEAMATTAPDWLTGGSFGLEASLPGLLGVSGLALMLNSQQGKAANNPERV